MSKIDDAIAEVFQGKIKRKTFTGCLNCDFHNRSVSAPKILCYNVERANYLKKQLPMVEHYNYKCKFFHMRSVENAT